MRGTIHACTFDIRDLAIENIGGYHVKNLMILLLIALSSLCACSRDESPVDITKHPPGTSDASIVVANCDTLKAAVERFASENSGVYPANVDVDTSRAGHTVLELLPAGGLENPFTKSKEAPVNEIGRASCRERVSTIV